ncbi:MAG: FAD-linked oxidase C-terminal domain-containing protein [Chloroflexota bacterium]
MVRWRAESRILYEYDYGLDRATPDLVLLPRSVEQVHRAVRIARSLGVPIVPRGAGTGVAGGAVPVRAGVVLCTARLNRILSIDPTNRIAVVEPGVINAHVTQATSEHGLFFAPDPSSQRASTIGGNVGTNAGGPHCLLYGNMVNHVLGMQLVTSDGAVLDLGAIAPDHPGFDLPGLVTGAEGTVGIVTRVTLRLLPEAPAVCTLLASFQNVDTASAAVSRIIAAGIVPAALELMDQLSVSAIEASFQAGFPRDAGAVLLIEIEGTEEQTQRAGKDIQEILTATGALATQIAQDPADRTRLWAARKGAASALGRIAPNYYLHDAVVKRSKLPEILRQIVNIGERHNLPIANLFHAGDGNLHPLIMFDARVHGATARVMEAGHEILRLCVTAGGSITGEHGVGVEKNEFISWTFNDDDLDRMSRVRAAFDPAGSFNPGKIFPSGTSCMDRSTRAAATVPSSGHLWV